ncbi:MAG TPA: 6-bladed beta-propeller [Gemmatimonadaceae bacterium]|nr:6-bladed beta-propeller [Gemmatimonadaceae bacterium]
MTLVVLVCGTARAQGAPSVRTVVRTSGDTTIAHTTGDVSDSQLRRLVLAWQASPDLADEGLTIGDINSMAVGPDGRVYVWDPATPALWVVDANGKSIKRIMRQGAGPGEYVKNNNGIVFAHDGHVKMWDDGNVRINVYDADGRYLSSNPLGFNFCCPGGAITADKQNRLWLRAAILDKRAPRSTSDVSIANQVTAYFRTNASGEVIDTVIAPKLPGNAAAVTAMKDAGGRTNLASSIVPYSTAMIYAVSSNGHLVFGQGRPYTVHSTFNGKPLRIERDWTPVPVPHGERAQHRARLESSMRRVDPDWEWSGPDVPAEKPAYRNLTVEHDGRIRVALSVPSEEFSPTTPLRTTSGPALTYRAKEQRWDIFEPDGRYLGRIVAPRTFGFYVMRGNFVWGVMRDEDDVPTIVKMRIVPGM